MPMTEAGQEGTLAGSHEGKPGLPRGRSGLPLPRLRGARVSRRAFYAHFADKEDCFLAATAEGRELMIDRIVSATRALPAEAGDDEMLRVAIRAFLAFLAGN